MLRISCLDIWIAIWIFCKKKFVKMNSDSDEENCVVRTKNEQIYKIISFIKENNNGDGIEKAEFALMWERLVEQLNDLGPPKHPVKKWKRIWSVYKYNNKTRFICDPNRVQNLIVGNSMESNTESLAENSLEPHTENQTNDGDQNRVQNLIVLPGNSMESNTESAAENSLEPHTENNSIRTEFDKLSLVLKQQETIIKKLDKHEDLLKEIIKKI